MKVLIGIISLLLLSEVGWAANCPSYDECMASKENDTWGYYNKADARYLRAIAYELHDIKELLKQRESGGESDLAQ